MAEVEKNLETDLFGDPWTEPKDSRGRKRHKRVPQIAEKIAVLRATGQTVEQIALRIGISEPTLRKYYLRELSDGVTLAQAVLTEALWERAKKGYVGAARMIMDGFEKGRAQQVVQPTKPEKDTPKMGKKEEQQAAAGRVVGLYGTPSPPTQIQ